MARPRRLEFPGGHYHVTSRGNSRALIYLDDHDRQVFLQRLGNVSVRLRWRLLAYCLMPNHYHLFVATPQPSLARGMQELNSSFAQRFNRRHERVGHVFQGRYKASLVDTAGYLLNVIRYIVRNPVRAKLCQSPEQWPWSSHAAALGLVPMIRSFDWDRVLGEFGPDPESGMTEYMKFIAAGSDVDPPPVGSTNPAIIGDQQFLKEVCRRAKCVSREIVRPERVLLSLPGYVERAEGRDDAIRSAHASGTYSLAQIASHFGLHYSTVSKICRKPEKSADDMQPFLEFD